jgi:hypothetical protein
MVQHISRTYPQSDPQPLSHKSEPEGGRVQSDPEPDLNLTSLSQSQRVGGLNADPEADPHVDTQLVYHKSEPGSQADPKVDPLSDPQPGSRKSEL